MRKGPIVAGGAGASLLAIALGVSTPEITTFEGQRNQAYKDVVGVLTVCAGHTGKDIVVGKVYTNQECDKLTRKDSEIAANGVLRYSPHLAWHPMILASMVSFSYNVGTGTYQTSTVRKLIDQGKFMEACDFLPRYKYAGGKVFQGLVNRRARERDICISTLTAEGMKNVAN